MSLRTVFYAYIIGGVTFIPLVVACTVLYAIYTSVPVTDRQQTKFRNEGEESSEKRPADIDDSGARIPVETYDVPRTRKGWLVVRRTFDESPNDTGYVNMMRSFLDARTKDPKRLRPKDTWYVVLKGTVLYLYEDEEMTECEAAIELSGHEVIIYPEGLLDGELFARRNAICLRPKLPAPPKYMPSVAREMKLEKEDQPGRLDQGGSSPKRKEKEREKSLDMEKKKDAAGDEALNPATPWFIFVRSNTEMEDWYLALIHASEYPAQTPTLEPLQPVFEPSDMDYLVATLDEQPDVIPMRWFNALIGRIFFSYYRTHTLEAFIIGKLMKKLSKVKRPTLLSDIVVKEVSLGDKAPTFSKPMLKELTKEGDASMEVHAKYKGEVRITVEATATINLRKTYNVKLVLAAILREIEGNMLIKVKRPPSNRIWYAFTQMPRIVLDVEPVVSDRQITWGMILSTIESRLKEIIQESVVLPNMDDISFFESSPYKRRGGIWGDASRTENREILLSKYQEASSVGGGSIRDTPTEFSQSDATNPTGDQAEAEALNQSTGGSAPIDSQTGATEVPSRGQTFQDISRRSSLSGPAAKSEGLPILVSGEGQATDEADRGRSFQHVPGTSTSTRSSRSRDEKNQIDLDQSDGSVQSQSLLSSRGLQKSSSRQSLHTNRSLTDSPDLTNGAVMERTATLPHRRVSDAASTTSTSASPPGKTSFLSTLRSKDKQAIKDSAKEAKDTAMEAIRKLGVNWGLKREWTAASNNEQVSDNSQSAKDGPAGVTRPSYAEVRAAVAERKEREKSSLTTATVASVPKDVPSDIPNTVATEEGNTSGALLASPAPPPGDLGAGQKRPPSRGRTVAELDGSALENHQHAPILVQPRGKTMTIPGIHASHRGEIMALGYVAPSMGQADNKNKNNPTINSLYHRLMKSPALSNQENSQVSDGATTQNPATSDSTDEVPPLALTPAVTGESQSRPAPPPLPPRSKTATALPVAGGQTSTSETPKIGESLIDLTTGDGGSLESSPLIDEGSSSGSEAELNDGLSIKASLISGPPPLPPRRIQTST